MVLVSTVSDRGTKSRSLDGDLTGRLLAAARAELAASGPTQFRIDDIVRRCHTSKSAVYRRWANRDAFLAAAIESYGAEDVHELTGDPAVDIARAVASWVYRDGATDAQASGLIRGITAHAASRGTYERVLWPRRRDALCVTLAHYSAASVPEEILRLPQSFVIDTVVAREKDISRADIARFVENVYLPLLRALARS